MKYFVMDYGIQLIISTPFYVQANGLAETSTKVLIGILEKMLVENPKDRHRILSETLWAYRTSKRSSEACNDDSGTPNNSDDIGM